MSPVSGETVVDGSAPSRRPPRWGLGDAAGGYAAAFVLAVLGAGLWVSATGEQKDSLGLTLVYLVGQWTGMVATLLLASRRKGAGALAQDFGLRVRGRDVPSGVLVGLACQFVLVPVLYLPFRLFDPHLDLGGEARRLTALGHGLGLVVLTVCVVAVAPVVEELFFRGLLQRSLDRRLGPRWAVALSSLAFGIVHYQPLQLLGLVGFGVVLGLLAERTGRLGPGIVAHISFNAATIAVLLLGPPA